MFSLTRQWDLKFIIVFNYLQVNFIKILYNLAIRYFLYQILQRLFKFMIN